MCIRDSGNSGYSTTVVSLDSNISQRANVSWKASVEGPMSFGVQANIFDDLPNVSNHKITVYRFLQVETDDDANVKSSGSWTALLAIFTLMSLCSYIIYTGMEEEMIESVSEDISTSEKSVSEDEDLREMAISEETEDEKDLE